jgi:hypothetical protein
MASKEATIAKLRARIVGVVATPACADIRFKLANVHIHRFMYNYVAGLIQEDRIHVDTDGNPGYDHNSKTLVLDEDEPDATIVHESTHALINITHAGKTITKGVHETSAYLAEALWALNAGREIAIDVPVVDRKVGRLARKIKAFYAGNRMQLYDVEPGDYVDIQQHLAASALKMDINREDVQIGICNGSK